MRTNFYIQTTFILATKSTNQSAEPTPCACDEHKVPAERRLLLSASAPTGRSRCEPMDATAWRRRKMQQTNIKTFSCFHVVDFGPPPDYLGGQTIKKSGAEGKRAGAQQSPGAAAHQNEGAVGRALFVFTIRNDLINKKTLRR